jgi:DNA processing protein
MLLCQYFFINLCIMQKEDIKTISKNDRSFPPEFELLKKPAKQFYAAGNTELLAKRPRVGIVGSRRMTPYGREVARDMARAAARAGVTVVSGLAFGIDAAAHFGALSVNGPNIAVLPGSLTKVYPASHQGLAREIIAKNGLLISEYDSDIQPMRHFFIERNRLIAALSDVLLIVEAGSKSGTQHTVDAALGVSGQIAAVPGNITSPMSIGPNQLLRDGRTDIAAVTSVDDLLFMLGVHENKIKPQHQAENNYEAAILKALAGQPLTTDQLTQAAQLEISTLNIHLTMLEIKGTVERLHNKWRLAG